MRSLIHVICLLLSTVVCGVLCQHCGNDEIDRCSQNLRPLHNKQDGPVIARNEAELIEICNHQETKLSCINNYIQTCVPATHANVFKYLTSGLEEFIHDYCNRDSYDRRVYVKYLYCYNNHHDELNFCAKRHLEWNKNLGKNPAHKVETMRQGCCLYDRTMTCKRNVIRNGCPREGADFFGGMANKATRQFYQVANCDQQNYVLADCSDGAMATLSTSSYTLFFGSAIFVIFRYLQ